MGKLYGSRMDYYGNILLRTNGREERQRQKSQFCSGGRGEAETENLILWLAVLELLVGVWWWHEAQSLTKGWLEVHILDAWLGECQPWGRVRLSDWLKETHCVVETEWEYISVWFYDFLFIIFIFLLCFFLFVGFLQNRQVMVTSLGR